MQDDENQALQWKKKYFSALEKLEQVEKQSADTDTLLRRSLSRFTLALDGFDKSLDQQLDKLRDDIRRGRKALHIGQLSEEISKLGQSISQQQQSQPKNHQLLLTLLNKLSLPAVLSKQKMKLAQELSREQANQHISQHIDTFTLLLRAAQSSNKAADVPPETQQPDSATTQPKSGFFSRLLSNNTSQKKHKGDPEPLQRLLNEVSLPSPYAEQLDSLNIELNNLTDQTDLNQLISKLAKLLSTKESPALLNNQEPPQAEETAGGMLLQLLDRITLIDPYSQELEALREQVSGKEESQIDFGQILESLAALISHAQSLSQSEKQELEGFLLHITDTLDKIDSNLRSTQTHQNQLRHNSQQLDNAVKNQVSGIQTSVLEADDLSELKQCIQSRLQTINQHLDSFQRENEDRYEQMEQAMGSLVNQVIKIESESNHLRKSLEEQRNRATKDPLTGISNRLAYDEFMENEYSRWQRFQHDLTVVIWDIDHFKRVNDEFGHQAGDKALTIVAQLLKKKLRQSDYLARFGGEEFVSLLPETKIDAGIIIADKLREAISKTEFHFSDQIVPITISCGLAQFHEGDTPEKVFQRADAALYQAKELGRNRCEKEGETKTPALGGH